MSKRLIALAGVAVLAGLLPGVAGATTGAIRDGFNSDYLSANDDGSSGPLSLGFEANFFGTTYVALYANNNGNVTFDGAMNTPYTPFSMADTGRAIIAPFFADVDTGGDGSDLMRFGAGTVDGHAAYGVTWDGAGVGYFGAHTDKLNSFQVVLIDRSDIAVGDFDFEFNYSQIQWETGDASGGVGGLGGFSARVGYSNGTDHSEELAGSGVNGALLDGGSNALVSGTQGGSLVAGRYVFEVRNGAVGSNQTLDGPPNPEPVTMLSLLLGVGGVAGYIRKRRMA